MSVPKKMLLFWKVIAWSLFMIILFTLPGSAFKSAPKIPHFDLVVHVIFYFIQTSLLIQAVYQYNKLYSPALKLYLLLLLPLIMGLVIEAVQELLIPNRYWDYLDVAANITGLLLALVFSRTRLFTRLLRLEA